MTISSLDKWYPPCGPCAFCGHPDKRHRLWDMWCESHRAGDSIEELAEDYDAPVEYVRTVIELQPYQERIEEVNE